MYPKQEYGVMHEYIVSSIVHELPCSHASDIIHKSHFEVYLLAYIGLPL